MTDSVTDHNALDRFRPEIAQIRERLTRDMEAGGSDLDPGSNVSLKI